MDFSALERQYNLPAGILGRMEQTESGGNQYALSDKGAQGYFQFLPDTAKQYHVNPYDLNSAAQGAARYLSDLYKQTGSMEKAVAAYNWGPGNLEKYGYQNAPAETKAYVRKVMGDIASTDNRVSTQDMAAVLGWSSQKGPTTPQQSSSDSRVSVQDMAALLDLPSQKPLTPGTQAPAPKQPAAVEKPWYDKAMSVAKAVGEGSYSTLRGGVTGLLGAPGDLEQAVTQTLPQLWGQKPTTNGPWGTGTVFPTSDTISHGLTKLGAPPVQGYGTAEAAGNFAGGLGMPMRGVEEAAAKAAPLARLLGGKPAPESLRMIENAQKMGYKVPPSDATGNSKFLQDITNFGAGKGAEQNRQLFNANLGKVMGLPAGVPINAQTLAAAGKQIPARFASVIANKTVTVDPYTAHVIQNIIKTNPQAAAEIVADPALKVIADGAETGKVPAPAWFEAIKRLKDMQYSTTNHLDKLAYQSLVSSAEKPLFDTGDNVRRAYRVFNRQYRAYATAANATRGSAEFAQSGAIAPERMYGVLEQGAKSPQALSRIQTTRAPLERMTREATALGVLGKPKPLSEPALLNAGIAAGHTTGAIGNAGLYSQNSALKSVISGVAGGALRHFYESPAGQAALRGERVLTPAEIAALNLLARSPAATQGAYNSAAQNP